MTQRIRDLLILFALALLVNGAIALLITNPGYTDSYYYFNGGLFLADGQGLVEPYRWNYVNPPAALPSPGFDFWQPLPAFLSAAGILLFGRTSPFDSAQWMFVILIAFLPAITYLAARQLGDRHHAWIAGLITIFSGFYVWRWSLPESFTPFAVFGGACLLITTLSGAGSSWWMWLLAGALAGLSHLSRADGMLLVVIAAFGAILQPRRRWIGAGCVIAGYLVVMSPWFARNIAIYSAPLPPGGINAIWLLEYNDLFNYPQNVTPARFFASGWPAILKVRWDALVTNLTSFMAVQNLIFLTPLTLIAAWRRRRDPRLWPVFVYQLGMFAAMTFAFSLPGMRGGYFHSAGALLPATFALAALGLDDSIAWMSAKRGWRAASARRVFGPALVVMSALLTGFLVVRTANLPHPDQSAWNQSNTVYAAIGAKLDDLGEPPDVRVMSNDTPGFYFFTGRGGMPVPNGDEAALLRAAGDYQIRYLVLDENVPAGLVDFYSNGPTSARFTLVETFGSETHHVYLYRIEGPQ